jgi:hypothetical protein
MKQILIDSCSNCPYRKTHWSGIVFTGFSCSYERPNEIFISSYEISECNNHVHKSCPLEDVK